MIKECSKEMVESGNSIFIATICNYRDYSKNEIRSILENKNIYLNDNQIKCINDLIWSKLIPNRKFDLKKYIEMFGISHDILSENYKKEIMKKPNRFSSGSFKDIFGKKDDKDEDPIEPNPDDDTWGDLNDQVEHNKKDNSNDNSFIKNDSKSKKSVEDEEPNNKKRNEPDQQLDKNPINNDNFHENNPPQNPNDDHKQNENVQPDVDMQDDANMYKVLHIMI
jgi:hypothetical protein